MMNRSLQRQIARVQTENLHRAARGVNGHRTVASPDSRLTRSDATRLSATHRAGNQWPPPTRPRYAR
jgi:hypothetical protein